MKRSNTEQQGPRPDWATVGTVMLLFVIVAEIVGLSCWSLWGAR
jgi:hypothetical protein